MGKLLRAVLVAVAVVVMIVSNPVTAYAGCGVVGFLFGGCIDSVSDGMTDRTQIREDGMTQREQLEQTGLTSRTQIEQENETSRTQLEQTEMTQRVNLEQTGLTERERINADLIERLSQEQTERELIDALARQNSTHDLVNSAQMIALLQEKSDLLQAEIAADTSRQNTQVIQAIVNRSLIVILGVLFFMVVFVGRRRSRRVYRLPQPSYWQADDIDTIDGEWAEQRGEVVVAETAWSNRH